MVRDIHTTQWYKERHPKELVGKISVHFILIKERKRNRNHGKEIILKDRIEQDLKILLLREGTTRSIKIKQKWFKATENTFESINI